MIPVAFDAQDRVRVTLDLNVSAVQAFELNVIGLGVEEEVVDASICGELYAGSFATDIGHGKLQHATE